MPAKQRGWGDDEARPALPGQQARRRGKKQPVAPAQFGATGFAPQDPYLVAQDEDLDLAVATIACRSQSQDGAQDHVEEGEDHGGIIENGRSDGESEFWHPSRSPD